MPVTNHMITAQQYRAPHSDVTQGLGWFEAGCLAPTLFWHVLTVDRLL